MKPTSRDKDQAEEILNHLLDMPSVHRNDTRVKRRIRHDMKALGLPREQRER